MTRKKSPREIIESWIDTEEAEMKEYEESFDQYDNIEDANAAVVCEAKIAAWNEVLGIL